jgi:leucyl aminopeptidase (aminopeptidase T)
VNETDYVRRLAELVVKFGANVQPGQIVALSTEPGKEPLARAVAEVAYEQGAKFVDLRVFDVYLKRARALNADPDTLGFVPPWYGDQMRAFDALALRSLRFEGPGTDLAVGLLLGSRWRSARLATVDGIVHAPNIPTEEVFTTPDPERTDGVVTATKPLFVSGVLVTGLRVRFESGRAVEIDADQGAARGGRWPSGIPARQGSARWHWSTARAGSASWGPSSSTRCWTRTPPATSPWVRASTSRWTGTSIAAA